MSISRGLVFIVLAALLAYASHALFAGIPDKSGLIWVASSDVKEVRYFEKRRGGHGLCMTTRDLRCLALDSQETGYAELLAATKDGARYSVGYIEDRDIFSDGPERYNIIYAITVNGVPVASFENRVDGERYFASALLAVAILLLGLAAHAFIRRA